MNQDYDASVIHINPDANNLYQVDADLTHHQVKYSPLLDHPVSGIQLTNVHGLQYAKVTF